MEVLLGLVFRIGGYPAEAVHYAVVGVLVVPDGEVEKPYLLPLGIEGDEVGVENDVGHIEAAGSGCVHNGEELRNDTVVKLLVNTVLQHVYEGDALSARIFYFIGS